MLQLVQFRKQAMASLCVGVLFLCATPFMNTNTFRDPSGMFECKITLTSTVECQYEELKGCLFNCITECCLRYYYWYKPLLLTADGLLLIYIPQKSSDIGNYDIMNYVLYPILIYVAAIAYLYPAVLFYTQMKMEKRALYEYYELS